MPKKKGKKGKKGAADKAALNELRRQQEAAAAEEQRLYEEAIKAREDRLNASEAALQKRALCVPTVHTYNSRAACRTERLLPLRPPPQPQTEMQRRPSASGRNRKARERSRQARGSTPGPLPGTPGTPDLPGALPGRAGSFSSALPGRATSFSSVSPGTPTFPTSAGGDELEEEVVEDSDEEEVAREREAEERQYLFSLNDEEIAKLEVHCPNEQSDLNYCPDRLSPYRTRYSRGNQWISRSFDSPPGTSY